MITHYDSDYKETKSVVNGEIEIKESIQKLKDWIEFQFDVKVIHIVEDYLENLKKPRLNIILKNYEDVSLFKDHINNYDSNKQNLISKKYETIVDKKFESILRNIFKKKTDKYFVCFSVFIPIAKSDIVCQILPEQLSEFKRRNSNESIWQINENSMGMIVFAYKNDEIEDLKKSDKIIILKKEFYEMLKPLDKDGYFNLENIIVAFDSKQNFDENYESNWFYYYR